MKYIEILHKINNNIHLQYYREEITNINEREKRFKNSSRKTTYILIFIFIIIGFFFKDSAYVVTLFFLVIYVSHANSYTTELICFKLDRQLALNDMLIWTIEDLAQDKFFKERFEYRDSYLMDIFWDFFKQHDNIYFDEEGQIESENKYISASSLKKYIRDKLTSKYSDYYYKDIGNLYNFEDIHKGIEETFTKPRN